MMKNICMSIAIVGILLVAIGSSYTLVVFGDVLYPPNKQMNNGVSAENVICNETLQLMIKNNDSAICVKSTTVIRFTDSGFAIPVGTTINQSSISEDDLTKYFQISPILESELNDNTTNEDTTMSETPTKTILIRPAFNGYQIGDTIVFEGAGYRNQKIEVTLNDPNENEVFVEVFSIGNSGRIEFEIPTDESFMKGTYFLIAEQLSDSEITPVTLGYPSAEIQVIFDTFYHEVNSKVLAEIYASPESQVELSIIDSSRRTTFQEIVETDLDGYAEYTIDLQNYRKGVYSLVLVQGTEEVSEEFSVGLENTKMPISINLVKESFVPDDDVLIFGTSFRNSAIVLQLIDSSDNLIHEIESYTDDSGKLFSEFTLPKNSLSGEWVIKATSGTITSETIFNVYDTNTPLTLELDKKTPYAVGDFLTLNGRGLDTVSQVSIKIMSDVLIEELVVFPTSDGNFSVIWEIPDNLNSGMYSIIVDDSTTIVTINFSIS